MNARAKRILAAAGECKSLDATQFDLLTAIALMLDEATKPTTKASRAPKYELPVNPGVFVDMVRARLAGKIIADPVSRDWYGRIGKAMGSVEGLTKADIDTLIDWVDAGGLKWWTYGVPTFITLCTNFSGWLAQARTWDERGRQELGAKGGVGVAAPNAGNAWDAFK
jgi:hypothetical protein